MDQLCRCGQLWGMDGEGREGVREGVIVFSADVAAILYNTVFPLKFQQDKASLKHCFEVLKHDLQSLNSQHHKSHFKTLICW